MRYRPSTARDRKPRVTVTCTGCGAAVQRLPGDVRSEVYCTRLCYQRNGRASQRKGGRPRTDRTQTYLCPDGVLRAVSPDPQGYWQVYWSDHPNANAAGRVGVHTIVMADHLERPLEPGETAHHKHGDKADNSIENLELWRRPQPAGVRVQDQVDAAIDLLRLYAPDRLSECTVSG